MLQGPRRFLTFTVCSWLLLMSFFGLSATLSLVHTGLIPSSIVSSLLPLPSSLSTPRAWRSALELTWVLFEVSLCAHTIVSTVAHFVLLPAARRYVSWSPAACRCRLE